MGARGTTHEPRRTGSWLVDMLSILPQQLVFGLALGTVYGLIALGYTMVYGILFMINFAHGEVFMIGAYVGWAVLDVAARLPDRRPASDLGAAAAAAAGDVGSAVARRDARALRLSPAVHARRHAARSADQRRRRVDLPAERRHADAGRAHEGLHDQPAVPAQLAFSIGGVQHLGPGGGDDLGRRRMMSVLNALVQRTTLGRCIRAVAEDREMAAVMGVDVGG